MSADPVIVSLWRGKKEVKEDLLCSGLLLTCRHILTVRHAFKDWPEQTPVYVRHTQQGVSVASAHVRQCHPKCDAAILKLATPVDPIASPDLQREAPSPGEPPWDKQAVTLRFIDPDHFGWSSPSNYAIASIDHDTGEYVIAPENTKGSSGGIAEIQGRVIGLLSRRKLADPLCRAVPMHLLWPWIAQVLQSDGLVQGVPDPLRPTIAISPAYRKRVAEVRKRVRACLGHPGTQDLVPYWDADPLAGLDADPPAAEIPGQVRSLLWGLHRATEACLPVWQCRPNGPLPTVRNDCRALLSDLLKLAVNPAAGSDLAAIPPEHIHLNSRFGGTGDLVYGALADVEHRLTRQPHSDVRSSNAVQVDDLLPSGAGEPQRQEVLRKLWKEVMDDDTPGRIEGTDYESLLTRIQRRRERDRRRYFLTAVGPRDWCVDSDHRRWADELHLGLVLHEIGDCAHLLLAETELIDMAREYLTLLEDL